MAFAEREDIINQQDFKTRLPPSVYISANNVS